MSKGGHGRSSRRKDKFMDMDDIACDIDGLYPNEALIIPMDGGWLEPKFMLNSSRIRQITGNVE